MNSYDIVEWGKPLQVISRQKPVPVGSEVRVKIDCCGVCHSDLHIQDGILDLGNGNVVSFESVGVTLPFTMGHEIVGVIDAVGPAASARIGERCVVYPWQGCGNCYNCLNGREVDCPQARSLGTRRPGGYAGYVVVAHERYLLDYGTLDPMTAATCACSGLTAFSALNKLPSMTAEDSLMLVGAGGLGLAALHLAQTITPARIVVGDIDEAKLKHAARAGADAVVNLKNSDIQTLISEAAPQGVRAVIDFVGSAETVALMLKVAGRGSTVIVVGLFGGALSLSTALLPMRNITLRGSYVGSLEEMKALIKLAQKKPSSVMQFQRYPMSRLNDALNELRSGRVTGRLVTVAGE